MKIETFGRYFLILVSCGSLFSRPTQAATTANVSVGDNFFNPPNVTINANDSVKWNWTGFGSHSSTGPGTPSLWDSGVHANGFTFTQAFPSSGTFAYRCVIHSAFGQVGNVTVQAVQNVPPTVALTSPTNGAVFAAPWTGTISATDSDTDGTVTKLQFFSDATLLGTVSNPSATVNFTATNITAGTHVLKAVATDNLGATNGSSGVTVQVLTPTPITLSAIQRSSPTSFQFVYSATPGLRYVIERTFDFSTINPLATNTATANPQSFTDNSATAPYNFYSVRQVPNP